jgi:hypothetical protein
MSTMVRASMAISAAMAVLLTSGPLNGQAVAVKAGPRGMVPTAARASVPAAVRVSRPPQAWPERHDKHDRFRRGYLPYGYFPAFAATRTVTVEPTVIYVDNSVAYAPEQSAEAAAPSADDEYNSAPGAKRLVWKRGGITPVAPSDVAAASIPVLLYGDLGEFQGGPHFRRFGLLWFASPDCEETQVRQRPDRRRLPWGLGWLQRYGRDVEVERGGVAPPSMYLRSPLLSGLYRRPDCPREQTEIEETCAVVTLVADDDAAMTIEVPLPQLDATSARQLRNIIRASLADGETIVLTTTDHEKFDLMPGSVGQVDAVACS